MSPFYLSHWIPRSFLLALAFAFPSGMARSAPAAGLAPEIVSLITTGKVVFVGDSITYSGQYVEYLEAAFRLKHPTRTFQWINIGLPSETLSGLSEPGHAGGQFPRPDLHERLERILKQVQPQLVVACYGMNDGIYYPFGEDRFAKYKEGMERLRDKAAAAGARVLHITPPTFDSVPIAKNTLPAGLPEYRAPYVGYNDVLDRYSAWLVGQRAKGWPVVDIHSLMNDHLRQQRLSNPGYRLAGDGVHIDANGHWLIARELIVALGVFPLGPEDGLKDLLARHPRGAEVLAAVEKRQRLLKDSWLNAVGHKRPGMGKGKPMSEVEALERELDQSIRAAAAAFPGKLSKWFEYDRYDFEVGGRPALVVAPRQEAPGRPWVWHGEFFGHKPAPDIALLGKGFHVVYLSVPDQLGGPEAVRQWNLLYQELRDRFGFAAKAALVGLSRGGLYCYNWAAVNPDKVACIYGDAPVCDFKSWPGGKGKGKGSERDWKLVLERYGFQSEAEALAYRRNPIDTLAPLAAAGVPLLHVYGDADEVVPWDENTGILAERYKKLGGTIQLIAKPGVGHHPHGLDDSTPIVEFILKNSLPPR
ncbi:MAG: hypothetical protein JNN07_26210 [Verrucomicrobiales bacterium]|nr:hypothetical protein [Verrucomicrobiales bacterium]